jgi:hypothetical protein
MFCCNTYLFLLKYSNILIPSLPTQKEIATAEVATDKTGRCYNAHAGAGKIKPSTRIRRTRSIETMDRTSRAMPMHRTRRLLLLQGVNRLWIPR